MEEQRRATELLFDDEVEFVDGIPLRPTGPVVSIFLAMAKFTCQQWHKKSNV